MWEPIYQEDALDDDAARLAGHVDAAGNVLPHGTWIVQRYYRLWLDTPQGLPATLYVIDQDGAFASFDWDGAVGVFTSSTRKFATTVGAGGAIAIAKQNYKVDQAFAVDRRPTLSLVRSGDATDTDDGFRVLASTDSHPAEGQIVEYDVQGHSLTWRLSSASPDGKQLQRCVQQLRKPAVAKEDSWGYVFRSTPISQIAMPFEGFHPDQVPVYQDAVHGYLSTPGTQHSDGEQEQFNGRLIFDFPLDVSGDWTRAQDVSNQLYLPLGLRMASKGVTSEQTHTTMASSVADRVTSWSTSLGLSGGIEGVLTASVKGTYKDKVEQQSKTENRFAQANKLTVAYDLLLDIPQIELDPDFSADVQQLAVDVVTGKGPDWQNFLMKYGTHYCNAMTHGHLRLSETQFSLSAETQAYEQSIDIEVQAEAGIEGAKIGDSASVSEGWSSRDVHEVSSEDVSIFEVGSDDKPMAVFLDLRPITELFSPLFFPYSAATDWATIAPVVWWTLRDQLQGELVQRGVGANLDPALGLDTTPQRIHVAVTQGEVRMPALTPGLIQKVPALSGLRQAGFPPDVQVLLALQCLGRSPLEKHAEDPNSDVPEGFALEERLEQVEDEEAWRRATANSGGSPPFVNLTKGRTTMADWPISGGKQANPEMWTKAAVDVAVRPTFIAPIQGAASLDIQVSGTVGFAGQGRPASGYETFGSLDFVATVSVPVADPPSGVDEGQGGNLSLAGAKVDIPVADGLTVSVTITASTMGGLHAESPPTITAASH